METHKGFSQSKCSEIPLKRGNNRQSWYYRLIIVKDFSHHCTTVLLQKQSELELEQICLKFLASESKLESLHLKCLEPGLLVADKVDQLHIPAYKRLWKLCVPFAGPFVILFGQFFHGAVKDPSQANVPKMLQTILCTINDNS